jgi:hypothetical protein
MAEIQDFASLTIGLTVNPASQANFSVPLLMVDSEDVPIDKRYIITTRSSKDTDLTADSAQLAWAGAVWGQNYNPAQAYIGRWVSAASSPYIVFGSPGTNITTWAAVADGTLRITDGTNDDDLTALSFAAVTDLDDVAQVIETALQAIAIPNITGLDTATCEVDQFNRIIIKNSTTGSAAAGISAAAEGTGTDLNGSDYLGSSFSQDGLDAETLTTAANLVFALDNTPFILNEIGANTAQQVAFATGMNSLKKFLLLVVNDTDAKDSAISTDTGYQLNALGYNRCFVMYTEHTTQYPDGALCGEVYPQDEGAVHLAFTPLTGLSESGLAADGTTVKPLTATERAALEAKGYDYLVKPSTVTHFTNGLTPGGNEARIMVLKMYVEAKVDEDSYGYLIANNVVTFSDDDINSFKGIIENWLEVAEDRKGLEPGWTLEMPLASSFSAATKATHIMDLSDLGDAETQRAVNKVTMSLSWSV